MKKYKITLYDNDVTPYIIYSGKKTISGFVNKKLLEEVKQRKREFSKEFKDWYIWMKANFDNLIHHNEMCNWRWIPAMRLQYPGIRFEGIDYLGG